MDHCAAGRTLAERWNLPPDFQIVAPRDHDSQKQRGSKSAHFVHLGCRLADNLGFWVVKPLREQSPTEMEESLPPLLARRIHIVAERWGETV